MRVFRETFKTILLPLKGITYDDLLSCLRKFSTHRLLLRRQSFCPSRLVFACQFKWKLSTES